MSKKSVPFSVPNGVPQTTEARGRQSPQVTDSHFDEWVSDRNSGEPRQTGGRDGMGLTFDLAADRSLTEVIALSVFTPIALGWFWLKNAIRGRVRF